MILVRSSVMGFCSGVQSAVNKVQEAVSLGKEMHLPVYTIGPLIHNANYLAYLERQGVRVISVPEEAPPGIAVIRAHGIPKSLRTAFELAGYTLIEGTCPRVLRSQRIVRSYAEKQWQVVLAGDPDHGEVHAVAGEAGDPSLVAIVHTADDVRTILLDRPVVLLSQTTFSAAMFEKIAGVLEARVRQAGGVIEIIKSICPSTSNRQDALKDLGEKVDAIIVIGGKDSSNTKRLHELALSVGKPAWHINDVSEVKPEMCAVPRLGITAGASTPEWLIEQIEDRLLLLSDQRIDLRSEQ